MKVMSYNTLFGGFDGMDDRRFLAQKEVIDEVNPDVLLVQEAKQFESNGYCRFYEVETALKRRGFLALAPHTGQNTAIFLRGDIQPISFESDSAHFHHAAAFGTFKIPGFEQPITFVSAHLCPFGSHVRLIEAVYLASHAAADKLTIVAGDFNSVSPYDPEPIGWDTLPSHFQARYLSLDGKTSDKRILETLYQAGFIDIAHRFHRHTESTVPGKAFKGTEFIPFRSDYILASALLAQAATSYAVIKNDKTDMASDHYPIIAEFACC
jgi:endonuclease/exonuclease/phosphatase family metal-dependent hydrolase